MPFLSEAVHPGFCQWQFEWKFFTGWEHFICTVWCKFKCVCCGLTYFALSSFDFFQYIIATVTDCFPCRFLSYQKPLYSLMFCFLYFIQIWLGDRFIQVEMFDGYSYVFHHRQGLLDCTHRQDQSPSWNLSSCLTYIQKTISETY